MPPSLCLRTQVGWGVHAWGGGEGRQAGGQCGVFHFQVASLLFSAQLTFAPNAACLPACPTSTCLPACLQIWKRRCGTWWAAATATVARPASAPTVCSCT
jgi:hypothetical protein